MQKEFSSKHTDDADIQRFLKANPSVAGVYEATTISADSDLLTKQNVYNKEIEIVDGHRPAIRALLDMQRDMMDGTVEAIRARFPNEADALIQAMWSDADIFLDADGTFRLREDFVAGNAWEKIDALDAAIKAHPGEEYAAHRARWQAGIEALRDAAGWVPIEDADVSPQAVWIPEEIVNRWADTYRKAPDGYRYGRNESGKWGVIAENKTSEWDFKRRTYIDREAGEWREHNDEFVYFLNSQKQRGKYTDTDTYNKNALASFKTWLATDEQARAEIEEIYNRQFNTELGAPNKTYAVNIEGWNPNIELKPWQWQSIHHLYRQGKGISALGTGYGKTRGHRPVRPPAAGRKGPPRLLPSAEQQGQGLGGGLRQGHARPEGRGDRPGRRGHGETGKPLRRLPKARLRRLRCHHHAGNLGERNPAYRRGGCGDRRRLRRSTGQQEERGRRGDGRAEREGKKENRARTAKGQGPRGVLPDRRQEETPPSPSRSSVATRCSRTSASRMARK